MMAASSGTNEGRRLAGGAMLALIGGLGIVLIVMLGPTHFRSLACYSIAFLAGAMAGLGATVALGGLARLHS